MIPTLEILHFDQTSESEEFEKEFLRPGFIEPLEKLGFEIKGYQCITDDIKNPNMSCHILFFREKEGNMERTSKRDREIWWKKLLEICSQDDDGQPHATHRYYNGDLYLMIPYNI